jgi:hypothetical protein
MVGVDHIPPHCVVGALALHNTLAVVRGYSHVVSYTVKTDDVGGNTCATKPDQPGGNRSHANLFLLSPHDEREHLSAFRTR